MTPAFDRLLDVLKRLPGLGYRSAERIALHLLVEKPESLESLVAALREAAGSVRPCTRCGNIAEGELCAICADPNRDRASICVVEHVPDLIAMERSGSYRGLYHVLQGKLAPIRGVGPDALNIAPLLERAGSDEVREVILALSNDVEGEATCHWLSDQLAGSNVRISRIGFGLPSGGGVVFADPVTLKSALEGRRDYL
ncbi:MAG: recombination protein RecR [Verrucomicrobia bacterium]|nr:MAG: recombination protein RecR [Verrucomicrobiota bacterium]